MATGKGSVLRVGVAGLGAVGGAVARRLDEGIPGLRLAAVSARDRARAEAAVAGYGEPVPVVTLGALPALADVIVEGLPAAAVRELLEPALAAGRTVIVIRGGALISMLDLVDLAAAHGGRIIVPSGALIGLDTVTAAAEGTIRSVRMVTRKPVAGLLGAPYLEQQGIDLRGLDAPLRLFEGSAREAAAAFPANLNVAAALGLAGIGPDRTRVEIWADPGLTRNSHAIVVESDSAEFEMRIANIPSEENPKTGKITALSVIAALRRLTSPLVVGT